MARQRAARDERGETLVELLAAIVLIGLAFAIVIGGLGTAIVGATASRRVATLSAALSTAEARVVAAEYVACAGPTSYDLGPAPEGYDLEVTEIAYWDGVDAFDTDCPDPDYGLQRLTLRVTGADAEGQPVRRELVIVKRQER